MSVYSRKTSNGSRANPRRAAFYDLDGTLVGLNLVNAALFMLANVGEWSGRLSYLFGFAARIPQLYLAERRDRRLLNTVLFESFKGVSRHRIDRSESQRRDRAGAGYGLAGFYRGAPRAPSRDRRLRRESTCVQPRS